MLHYVRVWLNRNKIIHDVCETKEGSGIIIRNNDLLKVIKYLQFHKALKTYERFIEPNYTFILLQGGERYENNYGGFYNNRNSRRNTR